MSKQCYISMFLLVVGGVLGSMVCVLLPTVGQVLLISGGFILAFVLSILIAIEEGPT